MTLLNSMALFATATMIVPIIVHLRRRRKSRVVEWPAMQFLSRTLASRRRGLKLEEFLLLFLRCLIVLLFAFAMARPVVSPGQAMRWAIIAGLTAGGLITLVFSLVGQITRARRLIGVVVATLQFAVAVSLLGTHSQPLDSWGEQQDVAIVIDGSETMLIEENSQSYFQTAIQKASALTRRLSGQSTVSIILAGSVSRTIAGSPFRNLRLAEQSLADLKPTLGGSNLSEAIELAKAALARGTNPRKQVVIFTDNQLHNWELVQETADAERGDQVPTEAKSPTEQQAAASSQPDNGTDNGAGDPLSLAAHVAKLPVDATNLSVDTVSVRSPVPTSNRRIPCDVEISNRGMTTVRDLQLTLLLNGDPVGVESIVQLESGTSRTVRFLPVFPSAGTHVLQAKLEPGDGVSAPLREPLLEDNVASTVVAVIAHHRILVVNGNSFANRTDQSATFARLALDPLSLEDRRDGQDAPEGAPEDSRAVQVQQIDVTELATEEELRTYHMILLCEVPRLPQSMATRLARYVSEGGRLWVIPGQSADPDFYNSWKSDGQEEWLLPCRLVERSEQATNADGPDDLPETVTIAPESAGATWLKELFERGEHDLFDLQVSSFWKLVSREQAVTHLRLTTDDPLFSEHSAGKGRVLLQAIGLTQSDSNLISRVSFPVLMQLWTQAMTAGQSADLNFAPTANLNLELNRSDSGSIDPEDDAAAPAMLTLVGPANSAVEEPLDVELETRDGREFISVAAACTPGVYELRRKQDGVLQQSFTVTRDRKESDLAIASEERLMALSARSGIQWFREIDELTSQGITTDGGREIWKCLAFAVLWLLAAESLLIRWIRKQRKVVAVLEQNSRTGPTPVNRGALMTEGGENTDSDGPLKRGPFRSQSGRAATSRPAVPVGSLTSQGDVP